MDAGQFKEVNDILYHGAWINSSEEVILVWIAKTWTALGKELFRNYHCKGTSKVEFFKANVEAILLNRSGAWTQTIALRMKLGDAYARMLRNKQINKRSNEKRSNDFTKIPTAIVERRLKFRGHC